MCGNGPKTAGTRAMRARLSMAARGWKAIARNASTEVEDGAVIRGTPAQRAATEASTTCGRVRWASASPGPFNALQKAPMSIKSDRWIRRMAAQGMISPFEPDQVKDVAGKRVVSYGTSSYGYDIRCSREFKI